MEVTLNRKCPSVIVRCQNTLRQSDVTNVICVIDTLVCLCPVFE